MSEDNKASTKPVKVPLLPLRELLVFPSTVVPLFVGRDKSIQALEYARLYSTKKFFFALS